MKKDHHKWAVALSEAKVYHQQTLTSRQERAAETAQLLATVS
jgi:phosphohistidine phosphatase SixA